MLRTRAHNYRTHPFHLFGRDLTIAGMAGPHINSNVNEVFDFLKNTDRREVLIGLHDEENFTDDAARYGVEYYHIPIIAFAQSPVPATTYDAIYAVVKKATEENKNIAIHCGSGDGRTATALAALKLRELLENAAKDNLDILDTQPGNTDTIKPSTEDTLTLCTPLVKAAIESIRNERQAPDNSGIYSVEKDNDVKTLIEYEKYLRMVLKKELLLTGDKEKKELIGKVALTETLLKKLAFLDKNSGQYNESLNEIQKNLKEFLDTKPSVDDIKFHIKRVDSVIVGLEEERSLYLKPKTISSQQFYREQLIDKVALAETLLKKLAFLEENSGEYNESLKEMQKNLNEFLESKPSFDELQLHIKRIDTIIKGLEEERSMY